LPPRPVTNLYHVADCLKRVPRMRSLFLGTVFILGFLVLGRWLYQTWDDDLAQGLWDLSRLAWGMDSERERERYLAIRVEAIVHCIEGKEKVAREVIAGRKSLLEAAACCRKLSRAMPNFDERLEQAFPPVNSIEEGYCREVIDWVRMLQAKDQERASDAADRLEAELEELLLDGTPQLPW
jgi:hypothetical protein